MNHQQLIFPAAKILGSEGVFWQHSAVFPYIYPFNISHWFLWVSVPRGALLVVSTREWVEEQGRLVPTGI